MPAQRVAALNVEPRNKKQVWSQRRQCRQCRGRGAGVTGLGTGDVQLAVGAGRRRRRRQMGF
jgi:hypothetical protein